MKNEPLSNQNRRQFITRGLGGCALLCLAGSGLPLFGQDKPGKAPQPTHKFDTPFPRAITYKQFFNLQYAEFIKLAQLMAKELGEEKALAMIKKQTEERMLQYGRGQAERAADTSLQSYVKQFKDPNNYKISLSMEIVEDTENAFEIKVSECLWAATFLKRKAGKIGFAAICHGDYSWPKGFNPKIKMVRDKTLMQGHDCCNHRYIWTG